MAYIGENVTLIGDVRIEKDASVWHGSVLRGDLNAITVGEGSNIQDLTMVHVDEKYPVHIGKGCVIGHGCILHGCVLEDHVLVGMGAIVMDGCQIGANSIIGAGALVLENTVIPPGSLVVGSPAKVIRPVSETQREAIRYSAKEYVQLAKRDLKETNQ